MPQPSERDIEVFNAALELPPAERAACLDQACVGDAALRRRVEELLQASEAAGGFLEGTAAAPPGTGGLVRRAGVSAEKPGDRIGRYKLLQQIGEGGCGVVYMAEQEEPVQRKVALKVIKLGMDTKSVIARFEAERQALALMDHPNIARVLDAGATDAGRPYFVMELVRGIKITDYCDQNNLSTHERLALFIQVCRAVQHAHQKGIIHRDIKPSNILVTMNDGVPVPKVIDFGIAKATEGKLTDKTLFTAFEQFIGTPAYMSPEQAEMSALDIDTRSDIYSLGVLLYELLTGQTPFDTKKLRQAGLDEIRRTIREQEPARPSTCLSTMLGADLTTVANHRKAEPPRLIHLVRGDLDWIVMKALEKDRTRRYATANGLAMDLQRYVADEPVTARPPSSLYRLQKLARRNKLVFGAAVAVFLALLVGLGLSTYLLFREKKANQHAQAAQMASRIAAAKSDQVARFLQEMIEGAGPEAALGRDTIMMREILDKTEKRVGLELKDQPEVAARLLITVGGVYDQLGDYAKAEAICREAIGWQQSAVGREDETTAQWLDHLGFVQQERGDFAGAETSIRRALEIERKLSGEADPSVSATLIDLASVLRRRGDLTAAEATLRDALDRIRKWPGPEQPQQAQVLNDLGLVRMQSADRAGAEELLQQALALWKQKLGEVNPQVAVTTGNIGLAQWERGDFARAELSQRAALALKQKILGTEEHIQVAGTLNNLASVLRDKGDLAGAEEAGRRALAIETKLMGADHPDTATIRKNLAVILRRQGAAAADLSRLREALELNPADALTADAMSCLLASPFLKQVPPAASLPPAPWRYTTSQPASNWAEPAFHDADWPTAPVPSGFSNCFPRSDWIPTSRTNLWLRREFECADIPPEKIVFRLSRNAAAQIFLNGVPAAAIQDWTDADVLTPAVESGRAALKPGRNVLAMRCEDADGGAPIDVQICAIPDASIGMQKLAAELDEMAGREPGRDQLYAGRAGIFARMGRWSQATADLSKAIQLKPSEPAEWYQLGALLLETHDLPGYGQLRRQALERFAKPDGPTAAARIASLSLLVAAEGAELAAAVKLADDAAAAQYADGSLCWRQLAKGLAEYRRGQFANSVEWMDKALATAGRQSSPGWNHELQRNRQALAYLVKGMAHFQLRDPAAARAELNQGIEIVEKQSPSADSGDVGRDWPDWIIARLFLREAQALIR